MTWRDGKFDFTPEDARKQASAVFLLLGSALVSGVFLTLFPQSPVVALPLLFMVGANLWLRSRASRVVQGHFAQAVMSFQLVGDSAMKQTAAVLQNPKLIWIRRCLVAGLLLAWLAAILRALV